MRIASILKIVLLSSLLMNVATAACIPRPSSKVVQHQEVDNAVAVYTESQPEITIPANENAFSIELKSNPTTGYRWSLKEYDSRVIKVNNHKFIAPTNKKLMGAPGHEVWNFTLQKKWNRKPQETELKFVYARSWAPKDNPKELIFKITIE